MSLTISELTLLGELASFNDQLAMSFYEQMNSIDPKVKSQDVHIKEWAERTTSAELVHYNSVWKICNEHLPVDEKLNLPKTYNEVGSIPEIYSFSKEQLIKLASFTLKF